MPYADPARSPYCAARHLLRHLGNALELRRNPFLAASIRGNLDDDGVKAAAQALLDRAFSAIDETAAATRLRQRARHAAILLRCDVLRQSRIAVARDLGLSLPQFERERRAAMARLVGFLENEPARARVQVQPAPQLLARTVRDRAMRLGDSGDRQSALTLLDDVVRTAPLAEKARALICVAEIETADHAPHRARAALDSAAALLRNDAVDASSGAELAHEAASLRLQTVQDGPQVVARSLRVRDDLPRQSESIALLVAQAEVLDGCGMVASCRPFISHAVQLVSELPEVEPVVRIDLAFLQCQLNFWLDPSAKGRSGLEEAIAAAKKGGYAGRAMFAELSRLGGEWAGGRDDRARRTYRALLKHIASSDEIPRQTKFYAYWDAADLECGVGDPWRAADAARNALALAPNARRALLMKSLLARAYARGGRLELSRRIALEVARHSESGINGMALLSAKRTLAYLASTSGRARDAWEHLSDAAELARRYGTARVAADLETRLLSKRSNRAPSVSIVL